MPTLNSAAQSLNEGRSWGITVFATFITLIFDYDIKLQTKSQLSNKNIKKIKNKYFAKKLPGTGIVRNFRLSKYGKGGQQTPEGSEVRWA
jgi:hypothetical protein